LVVFVLVTNGAARGYTRAVLALRKEARGDLRVCGPRRKRKRGRSSQPGLARSPRPTLVSKLFHREGWVYEEKYDGWRMLAYAV